MRFQRMLIYFPLAMQLSMLPWLFLYTVRCSAFNITSDGSTVDHQSFDYVIVGGGTAGLTIANRLTENPRITVLVIEVGINAQNDSRVTDPGNFSIVDTSDLEWGYTTVNQTVGGNSLGLTVGKVLGGSSTINGMQWTRGTASQYDALEKLGNPGWNFASMQRYMRKAEAFHTPNQAQINLGITFSSDAHGKSGRVITGFPNPYPCPLCKLWDTLVEATVAVIPGLRNGGNIDQCSGNPNGVARCSYSIIPGASNGPNAGVNIRSSAAQSFLYSLPPNDRPNLYILTENLATKIIWKPKPHTELPTPRAIAFQDVRSPQSSFLALVNREVIVSSGSIGSPKFLELSGIGNRRLLESLNIAVISDLPSIGINLQDQAGISSAYTSAFQLNTSVLHSPSTGAAAFVTLPQVLGVVGAQNYVSRLTQTITRRATEIVKIGAGANIEGVSRMLRAQAAQFGEENAPVLEIVFAGQTPTQLFGTAAWILLPQYRGSVHIVSSDPLIPPAINPNYLLNSEDLSLLVNTSTLSRHIFNIPSVKQLYTSEVLPGVSVQTQPEFESYVHDNYFAVLHPIGTVSMLPHALGGAVDANLRVYGVKGVRVADASILPLQISAHLSSTVYGIAEKAADLIQHNQP
ncbi:alcohol oxidase [Crucibulum laeve]|uniref:pyranose dehydrogenase (acceptor) n=1 Tax=Crucibulum laeve TaxID=68775 RepID=A0A5C3LU09_9AGAR|nr:alcohol oxidase [Crucibulum laeve]